MMVYGRLPLAVLKENWCGLRDAPLNLGQSTAEYLNDLRTNLEVAGSYATEHGKRQQQRYVSRYNLRSREKQFHVGDCKDATMPFIFSALYMLKLNRSIADTRRQSYMRKLACGIRHHQNCRIGPSPERTVEILKMTEVIVEI